MPAHVSHELIELIGALTLTVGGALILGLAWRERRTAMGLPVDHRPSAVTSARSSSVWVLAGLSLGAAAIHLAAAPQHVEELGELGLGFYIAALFQAAWALAWLGGSRSARAARIGLLANVALLGAWAWSRLIGLPVGPAAGVPEAIGAADGATVIFQGVLVGLLILLLTSAGRLLSLRLPGLVTRSTMAAIPAVGIIFIAATIGVSAATAGHGHDDGHDPSDAHGSVLEMNGDQAPAARHVPGASSGGPADSGGPVDAMPGHGHSAP